MPAQRRIASSFTEALQWVIAGNMDAHREVIKRLAMLPERPPTPEQMKLLAELLQKFHTASASRPRLIDLDPATTSEKWRVQMAQHWAAKLVLERKNDQPDHPSTKVMIAEAMDKAARKFNVSLARLSERAVRPIIYNKRPKTYRARLPWWHHWPD
jgi:hypothetical protein